MTSTTTEGKMINLLIPNLVDEMVANLQSVQNALQSPQNVISTLQSWLSATSASYFVAVATKFEAFVADLPTKGFRKDHGVFFNVPQRDGTAVELFPGGARVAVTPHNVEKFLALYNHFKTTSPYRYTDYPTALPLSPKFSLNSDFLPILELLEKEISKWQLDDATWEAMSITHCVPRSGILVELQTNGSTKRVAQSDLSNYVQQAKRAYAVASQSHYHNFENYVKAIFYSGKGYGLRELTEEDFRRLDVRYCVPVLGKIVDLIPNGQNIRVPFDDKDKFCQLAAEKLGIKLNDVDDDDRAEQLPDMKNGSSTSAEGLLSPRRYVFDIFAPSPTDKMANSLTKKLTPDEILFHFKMVLRQLATGTWNESDLKGLNLYFEVPINGKLTPLVENGFKIPVTLANKDDFVVRALDALHAQSTSTPPQMLPKQDLEEAKVLQLFSPSHFESDIFAPYMPSDQVNEEANFWAMLEELKRGFQPPNLQNMNLKFSLRLPNKRVVELKKNGANILVTEQNLQEFIDEVHAHKEAIHLAFKYKPDDLDPILQFPKEKAHTLNSVQLGTQDLASPLFLLVEGLAGNEFTPQEFETMKLMYCIPLSQGVEKVYDLVPDGRNIPVTAKYCDDFVSRVFYERDRLQASVSEGESSKSMKQSDSSVPHVNRVEPSRNRSISTIPLTESQIVALQEFRTKVDQLRDMSLDEASWNEFGMAWVIRCGNVTFDVIPDGFSKPVAFSQRSEFISKCLAKCDEILADQEGRKNIAVPQAGADELNLFSPTHFEQDLFAPPQHITTRVGMGASSSTVPAAAHRLSTHTTPPPQVVVPSPPSAPRHATIESLPDFLQRHNLGSIHNLLDNNGVTSVADLLELKDVDINDMITAVLPRRRLLEAVAALRRA